LWEVFENTNLYFLRHHRLTPGVKAIGGRASRRIVRDRIKSLEAIDIVTSRRSGKRHKYTLKIYIKEKESF
jgi:hypothetical protein